VTALVERHDLVAEDRLNHASLIDAARLAHAKVLRYAHADAAALERRCQEKAPALITTDAVFSMDGDIAPVSALSAFARSRGARLLLDDAHGLGVVGATGRGTLELFRLRAERPVILMGTLGKAFGVFGAFVAGEEALIETLIQRARAYIYTTALPPAVAEAVRASLKIVQEEDWRRGRLSELVTRFRRGATQLGFTLGASSTPIQPIILGESARALTFSRELRARGLLVPAIRPPTVPRGSARLRITFSAAHEPAHVDRLLDALNAIGRNP
jgi:8-amino-7-oxononanoate synthase